MRRTVRVCLRALALPLAVSVAAFAWAQVKPPAPSQDGEGGSAAYYAQSVLGHLRMMKQARPIADWLADPATPQGTKARLLLAQQIRGFASQHLHLPENGSYRSYADLGRTAVVWNVVAAPVDSLQLKTWCFPVAGCVGYRGYYDAADAQALALSLQAQGLEVNVYGVPAYSTLGKLNWLGGDPLLNTFLDYPDGEMARLIFHELAHQVVYVADDTAFNESFATAVERLGGQLWLSAHGSAEAKAAFELRDSRQQAFRALTARTRARLDGLYSAKDPRGTPQTSAEQLAKQATFAQLRQDYMALKAQWGGYSGYDAWIAKANNASLGAQGAYDDLVPQFTALFEANGRDFNRFYDAVRRVSALPKTERRAALLGRANQPGASDHHLTGRTL